MQRPTLSSSLLPSLALSALLLATAACSDGPAESDAESATPATEAAAAAESVQERAARMAREMLILDGHVDLPYRLEAAQKEGATIDISRRTDEGDFDYERARAGGLDAPFMSIYVPADYQEGGAKEFADGLIDMVRGFADQWPDKFAIATSPDEVLAAKEAGKIALPLGMENGAPIEDDLANLQHFFDRGIRYITLTHSKNNQISDSSYEDADVRTWDGLSPFGEQVVTEMNRLGIMVDISHVSDAAFYDVMEVTRAPAIASHSSARHFTPGFERNMDDDMIRKLAENGGVIQINFGSSFLTREANEFGDRQREAVSQMLEEKGLEWPSPEARELAASWREENPYPYASIDDVVAHIDHVVQLVGVDHVGLGSDYDGVGDSLPTDLKDVSTFPNLIARLLEKGYSEEDIEKILSGNVMRVWRRVEEVAREMQEGELAEAA